MNNTKAKEQGFTHQAKMYGFHGYYYDDHGNEDDTHETFKAKYILTDWIVEAMIYLEVIFEINEGFPIQIGRKL